MIHESLLREAFIIWNNQYIQNSGNICNWVDIVYKATYNVKCLTECNKIPYNYNLLSGGHI